MHVFKTCDMRYTATKMKLQMELQFWYVFPALPKESNHIPGRITHSLE